MQGNRSSANESVVLGPTKLLIGGQWVDSADGRTIEVECPASKKVIASTPRGAQADVERAVKAAEEAFPKWKKVTPRRAGGCC